jgi:Nucleoside transporter
MAGVAVSVVNFIVAFGKDPSDYYNVYCRHQSNEFDHATTRFLSTTAVGVDNGDHDVVVRFLKGQETILFDPTSCPPYTKIDWSVFVCFFVGLIVLVLCLVGFSRIHSIITQHDIKDVMCSRDNGKDNTNRSIRHQHRLNDYETIQTTENDDFYTTPTPTVTDLVATPLCTIRSATNLPTTNTSSSHDHDEDESVTESSSFVMVWDGVQGPAVCIFVTFFITLGLFPGWTSEIRSIYQCHTNASRLSNDLYVPFSFLLFNIGDFTGRLLSTTSYAMFFFIEQPQYLSTRLVVLSSLRFLFFPVLFLCNGNPSYPPPLGFYVESDIYAIVVQFMFAITGGFLISSSFVHASTLVPNNKGAQERMSEILSFAVSFGLFSGSVLSVLISQWTTTT